MSPELKCLRILVETVGQNLQVWRKRLGISRSRCVGRWRGFGDRRHQPAFAERGGGGVDLDDRFDVEANRSLAGLFDTPPFGDSQALEACVGPEDHAHPVARVHAVDRVVDRVDPEGGEELASPGFGGLSCRVLFAWFARSSS